jgi:hypothetical protein
VPATFTSEELRVLFPHRFTLSEVHMACFDSSAFPSPASTHQRFHWINGPSQDSAYAAFLEMAYDLAAGINTCLEIVHVSDLQRETNQDAKKGEAAAPAIGAFDAEKLLRMAIVSSSLLAQEAMRRIDTENAALSE